MYCYTTVLTLLPVVFVAMVLDEEVDVVLAASVVWSVGF